MFVFLANSTNSMKTETISLLTKCSFPPLSMMSRTWWALSKKKKQQNKTSWMKKRGEHHSHGFLFPGGCTHIPDISDCWGQKRGRHTCGTAPSRLSFLLGSTCQGRRWLLACSHSCRKWSALTRENCDCPKVVAGWILQWFGLNYYEATYPSLTNDDIFITVCLILVFTSLLFTNTEKET